MNAVTPIIIYLQDCAANRTLPTLLFMMPCNTAMSLQCMEITLNHLQALRDNSEATIIPNIKAVNVCFPETPPSASIWTHSWYQNSVEPHGWSPAVSLRFYIHLLYNQIPGFTRCPIYLPGYLIIYIQPLLYCYCALLSQKHVTISTRQVGHSLLPVTCTHVTLHKYKYSPLPLTRP